MGTDDPRDDQRDQQLMPSDDTQDIPDEQALALFTTQANQRIRKVFLDGRWWFSVIDVVGLLSGSAEPRKYWFDMKRRITNEGFVQLSSKCRPLKMRSPADGKYYTTDAADRETIFRIGESIPSPNAEPFKQWLAHIAEERLQEEEQPSKALDRLSKLYAKKGYSDSWIGQRIKKIIVRSDLTAEWVERGAHTGRQIAQLTTELHEGTFDITPAQHLAVKDLPPTQNLQDSMTGLELALSSLAEETATVMHQARDSQGMSELRRDVHEAGEVGAAARRDVEARIGQPVVSPVNYKQLRQERQRQLQMPLFEEGLAADE